MSQVVEYLSQLVPAIDFRGITITIGLAGCFLLSTVLHGPQICCVTIQKIIQGDGEQRGEPG
ncbi:MULTISPECIES: hypothetical protein [unclassified Brucella]|uniref:hypothetical protein n=1 Tax=unclassified Brucella TaxID=2632610 RepID=UPI0012ADCE03|nr:MULTISPECIES: hypothetical protein [unclassified Brucella]MRN42439.1 hypothetical protein [Brucella sp. 09RB8913]MRN57599.1 hypothetical protein [Brucella sp. 09RB8918]